MRSALSTSLPPKRTMTLWALVSLSLIIAFYGLILLFAAACVYLPLWNLLNNDDPTLDQPVRRVLLFLIGILMAGTMLWSVRPRRNRFSPPGPLLDRSSHPQLFREIENTAEALNERPPEEVYLLADINAWVANRGGVLGLGSHRVMGIGLPLVSILTISQFRAVLAHEFGHYYRGDTRLGPLVYRTRQAMVRTMENVKSLSFVTVFVVVRLVRFLILKTIGSYLDFYLRISGHISQLQEYRADELACHIAGSHALTESLQRIHAASQVFSSYWEKEVVPLLNAGYRPPIADGFARFLEAPEVAKACSDALGKEAGSAQSASRILSITTVSSANDSHPLLSDRIRAASILPGNVAQNPASASTLLGDIQAAEVQFLQEFGTQSKSPSLLTPMKWGEVASLFTVPLWKDLVGRVSHMLSDITAENLPDAVPRLRDIGAQIPDPKGMLLSHEQRAVRAGDVVGMALGLVLLNSGWQIHSGPGQFSLRRDGESLNPLHIVADIISGRLTREAWTARCKILGIAGIALGDIATTRPIAI